MFFSAVAQAGTQAAGHPIRDVVTFWLAILGFLLSVYNLAVTIYTNHKRISICVKAVYKVDGYAVLSIQITNKSRLGISLTSGEVNALSNCKIAFGETSTVVFTYVHPELSGKNVLRTDIFPIHIDPLHSARILMQTETWNPDLPCSCCLRFGSSRGWIQAKADLPAAFEDLQSLLRHLK